MISSPNSLIIFDFSSKCMINDSFLRITSVKIVVIPFYANIIKAKKYLFSILSQGRNPFEITISPPAMTY
jgi:hypothetical protein